MLTLLITLFLGITFGLLLATVLILHLLHLKCPQCKQLKPLREVIILHLRQRTITGQPCLQCQRPQPPQQIEL